MGSYSDFFNFGSGPSIEQGVGRVKNHGMFGGAGHDETYNYVADAEQDKEAAAKFDAIMAGHDATSSSYVTKLQSIYDGYAKYAADFGKAAKPIMVALSGDIQEMQGYVKDYGALLGEIKPLMMDGIKIDPSATRTTEEYQGNLASAYGKQAEQMRQSMASQGLNPFANKGADRELSLSLAAGMTDAGNRAHKDWRTQYNQDIQAKQQGATNYASLLGKQGDLQSNLMQSRAGLIDANASIMNAKMGADQLRAAGTENLLSLAESRRAEALKLGQQQQENKRYEDDIKQQLDAKISPWDKAIRAGTASSVYA